MKKLLILSFLIVASSMHAASPTWSKIDVTGTANLPSNTTYAGVLLQTVLDGKQPLHANLTGIAGIAAPGFPDPVNIPAINYGGSWISLSLSLPVQQLLDDTSTAQMRATLGAVAANSGTATNLTLSGTTTQNVVTGTGAVTLSGPHGTALQIGASGRSGRIGYARGSDGSFVAYTGFGGANEGSDFRFLNSSGGSKFTWWLNPSDLKMTLDIVTGLTIEDGLIVKGNSTLGDAPGDAVTINGSVTAPNATSTGSNNIANVGSLDKRFATGLEVVNRLQATKIVPLGSWVADTNGTGSSVSQSAFSAAVNSGTGAGAYALIRAENRFATLSLTNNFFDPFAAAAGYLFTGDLMPARVGQALRILVGGASSDMVAATFGTLDTAGVGVEINSQGTNMTHFIRLLTWEGDATVASSWVAFPSTCMSLWIFYSRSGATFTAGIYNASTKPPTLLVTRAGTVDSSPAATRGTQWVSCNDGTPSSAGFVELHQYIITTGITP